MAEAPADGSARAKAADGSGTAADGSAAGAAGGPEGGDALPVLVGASFDAARSEDTFLDVSHAGHGVAFVNGVCVGRYWNIGPQQTLYVPAPLVREGRNEVLLLDLDTRPTRLALAEEHVFGRTGG